MNLIRANCELLQQGKHLVSRHDETTFIAVDPASYGSGIGSHFRHVIDHYRSFLAALDTGLIDYDNRERDTAQEKDRDLTMAALEAVQTALEKVELSIDEPVRVKVSASTEGSDIHSNSSWGRELQFLVSHTVHHYALIAIASRMLGIYPDDAFGVAPSTLKYLSTAHS